MASFLDRGLFRILVLLGVVAATPQAAAQYTTADYDNIFSWAQTAYADALPVSGAVSGTALGYYYRYYPSASAFLGMKDDGVYFYTAGLSGPVYVGPVANFLSAINSCKPRIMESAVTTILNARLEVAFEDTAGVSAPTGLKRRFVLKNRSAAAMYLQLQASSTWGRVMLIAPQGSFAYLEPGGEAPGMFMVEADSGQVPGAVTFDLTLSVEELSLLDLSSTRNRGSVTRPSAFTLVANSGRGNPRGTPTVQFERVSQVSTKTGFWSYGVDDAQSMIVLFPGQENWTDKSLIEQSAIYAYRLDGTLLWKKDTGVEIWGGALSRDGKYVAYATLHHHESATSPLPLLVLLNAATGEEIWKKNLDFANFPKPSATKVPVQPPPVEPCVYKPQEQSAEVRFSPSGRYIAFGTIRGYVYLIDRDTAAVRWVYETFGQVRGISFDAAETTLYAGSGDGYLYRLDPATGALAWKSFIVSWPYTPPVLAPHRKWIVATTKSGDVTVIDQTTGACLAHFDFGILNVRKAVFSPDNSVMLAVSASDKGSVAFNTLLWTPLWTFFSSADTSIATDFSYALIADSPTGYLLDIRTGETVATLDTGFPDNTGYYKTVFVNADATRVVIARRDTAPDAVNLVFFKRKGL